MLLIANAAALEPSGQFRSGQDILINNGKIAAVGQHLPAAGCEVLDAQGAFVTPGLIDAHCHVGLLEDSAGSAGDDVNEIGDPVTPQLRAVDGINPRDRAFRDALAAGVTTVVTGPGSANVIGGQFCAVKTAGSALEEMLLLAPAAMKVAFGENPKRIYGEKGLAPVTRMAAVSLLRQALSQARQYQRKLEYASSEAELPEPDAKCEALLPVLRGELPLKIHAHRADDIQTAIRVAEEFGLRYTIDHCTEGYLMPETLKKHGVQCVLGPLLMGHPKLEMQNLSWKSAAVLEKAGIEFAFGTDHPEVPVSLLSATAAACVREGLSEAAAMRALTAGAAKLCGLSGRVGTVEAGKDADLAIFRGHPLDLRSRPACVLVNGRREL